MRYHIVPIPYVSLISKTSSLIAGDSLEIMSEIIVNAGQRRKILTAIFDDFQGS